MDVEVRNIVIGAGGLGFVSGLVKSDASCSPPLRRFFGAVLP